MALKAGERFQLRITGGDANRDGKFDLRAELEVNAPIFGNSTPFDTGPKNIPTDQALQLMETIAGTLPGPVGAAAKVVLGLIRALLAIVPV